VLRVDAHVAAVHLAVARDDTVARMRLLREAAARALVEDERVGLDEGAGVEEVLDALARGELALLVLRRDALGTPAFLGLAPRRVDRRERRLDDAALAGLRHGHARGSGPGEGGRHRGSRRSKRGLLFVPFVVNGGESLNWALTRRCCPPGCPSR